MQDINTMIIISGSGTNMQNLVLSCHKKPIFEIIKNMESNKDFKIAKNLLNKKINFLEILSNKANALGLQKAKNLHLNTKIIESKGKSREEFDLILSNHLNEMEQNNGLTFVLLAGFMRILSPSFFINISKNLTLLNIHPSFLPLHKGANALQDSYFDSNNFGGVSVHYVSKELDSGKIILQEKLAKIPNESLQDFENRIHALEYRLYPKAFIMAIMDKFKDFTK